MGRMNPWSGALLAGICLGLPACEERSDPAAPGELPAAQFLVSSGDGSGGGSNPIPGEDAPSYSSETDVPPEYGVSGIIVRQNSVTWYGAAIEGFASMDYLGNRGSIALDLSVLHDYSTVATNHVEEKDSHFLPAWYRMALQYWYLTARDCGQVANQNAHFEAKTVVIVNLALLEWTDEKKNSTTGAEQPACAPPVDPGGGGDGGGSGGGGTGEVWCMVSYWYDVETGEVLGYDILFCWVE